MQEFQSRVASGDLDPAWLRQSAWPAALDDLPPAARRSYYHDLQGSLAGALGASLAREEPVAGVVLGPDYARVVLEGDPIVTAVVRQDGGRPVIERFEPSSCSLCSEPERFVHDLLRDVQSGGGRPRLLVGVDLLVDPESESSRAKAWTFAWNTRNTDAGYLRFLLDGAEVVGADGQGVRVALAQQTETWPVVYRQDRWQLDYAGLPLDSPLRLADDRLDAWNSDRHVARQGVAWWVPIFEPRGDAQLIANEVRFIAPRPLQGDLLLYVQDLERSFALVAVVEPETGEVVRRIALPTLSKRENHDPETWSDLFVGALSPDGKRLAIGAHRRVWVVDIASSQVIRTLHDAGGVSALDWSPDGERLGVGDQRGVVVLSGPRLEQSRRHWAESLQHVESVLVGTDNTWMLQRDGLLTELGSDLRPTGLTRAACCGGVRGADVDPRTGDLLVGCDGSCDPAWLWRWDGTDEGAARVLADEGYCAGEGTLGVDPDGLTLVGPVASGGAAIWSLRDERMLSEFSDVSLTQVAWGTDQLYGLDKKGRAWAWALRDLDVR